MKPGVEKHFFAAAALWFFLAGAGTPAEPPPLVSATIISSSVYFEPPHEQQVKFRLSCAQTTPLPGALYDLKNMKVEKFSADGKLEAVVEAPQCIYAPLAGVANSAGHLELKSGNTNYSVHIEGDGFLWQQNELFLVVSNHQRTVIEFTSAKPNKP